MSEQKSSSFGEEKNLKKTGGRPWPAFLIWMGWAAGWRGDSE